MTPQRAMDSRAAAFDSTERPPTEVAAPICPACGAAAVATPIEHYGRFERFGCAGCGLQFWEPRVMPAPGWYEQMYGGRDARLMPLEPGHKYFLADPRAPGRGNLLDIGCGTGNFLAAAQSAGYRVTGTELDGNAARFAKERLGLERVLPLGIAQFAEQHGEEKFDVVTFFEVLEHQAEPVDFLERVKACLCSKGYVAMSVPNRERWLTGVDPLDYPPNHFLRWNAGSLCAVLEAEKFEVLTIREEPVGIAHAAQMINMRLRSGLTKPIAGGEQASFREVMQMTPEEATASIAAKQSLRQRVVGALARVKHAACYPLAVAALPYVRLRGYKGTYLYCLARARS